MSEVRINLNEKVKVRLTDHGKDIYYHQFDEVIKRFPQTGIKPRMPKVDSDGYTEFQLWHFMELYGEHIGMCKPNVIMPLEMVYEEGDR